MEIVVKINSVNNDQKNYQDGDIVQTFTNDHIHICHAEMICHPKHFALNTFGLRDRNTLLEKFMEKTSKYKFTRLNSNDVQRLNLLTNEEDILNTIPNSNNEYIDIAAYLTRRTKNPNHKIFGVSHGNEVWYGGIVTKDKVVIVRFGDPDMEIKVDDPERRKSFRARHNCDNPGPKWKARYWSCKAW